MKTKQEEKEARKVRRESPDAFLKLANYLVGKSTMPKDKNVLMTEQKHRDNFMFEQGKLEAHLIIIGNIIDEMVTMADSFQVKCKKGIPNRNSLTDKLNALRRSTIDLSVWVANAEGVTQEEMVRQAMKDD